MTHFRCDIDCPPEIWSIILDFACDEGSLPAIFLSRVSERFRHITQGYLHHIRIGSTPELLELDGYLRRVPDGPGMGDAAPRGTRFLSIVLPLSATEELDLLFSAFNPDDPSYALPLSEYTDIDDDDSSSTSSEDSDFARGTYENPDAEVAQSETEELQAEIQDLLEDIRLMPSHYPVWPKYMLTLEEMKLWPNASIHRECDIFKAIHNLLTVCADTLEVLCIFFKPFNLASPSLIFPVLPKLRRLTIFWGISTCPIPDAAPRAKCLFPSLELVRFTSGINGKDHCWLKKLLSLAYLTPERKVEFRVESDASMSQQAGNPL